MFLTAADRKRFHPVQKKTPDHLTTGTKGEQIAQKHLENLGMKIIETNWRHKRDEVDIIAEHGAFVVFAEVKTRSTAAFGAPEEWVDDAKQHKLMRAADAYIHLNELDKEVRFDVVSVVLKSGTEEVLHIPDAFYPTVQ